MYLRSLFVSFRLMGWRRLVGVARDASILTGQRVFQRLAGLVSLYFLVRHFSQEDLGHYQFVGVAVAAVAFMALPGLNNALMLSVSQGTRNFYRRAVVSSTLFSLLGAVLLAVAALAQVWLQPQTVGALLVTALLFPAYVGVAQWKSVMLAERRFLTLAAAESLTTLATHGALICSVLMGVRDVWIFGLLYLGPAAVTNVSVTLYLWLRTAPTEMEEETRKLYYYGLHTSAVTVVSMIAEQIERLAIFLLISPAAMAIYLAGDRLSELIRSVFQDAAAVLAPRFARMTAYDANTSRAIWLVCVIAGVVILVFAFTLAQPVLLAIFGPDYAPSVPYAKALLCSVAIGNVGQFQFRFIRSQLDSKSFRTISLWTSATRIICAVGLIAAFGVWGAVATVFINRLAISVLSSTIVRRQYRSVKPEMAELGRSAGHDIHQAAECR